MEEPAAVYHIDTGGEAPVREDVLKTDGEEPFQTDLFEDRMSCKAAVKGGRRLSLMEAEELLGRAAFP